MYSLPLLHLPCTPRNNASNISGMCAVWCLGIPCCRLQSGCHLFRPYRFLLCLLPFGPSCGSRGLCQFQVDIIYKRGPGGWRRHDNRVTLIGCVSIALWSGCHVIIVLLLHYCIMWWHWLSLWSVSVDAKIKMAKRSQPSSTVCDIPLAFLCKHKVDLT